MVRVISVRNINSKSSAYRAMKMLENERQRTFNDQEKILNEFESRHAALKGASKLSLESFMSKYFAPKDFYDAHDAKLNARYKQLQKERTDIVGTAFAIRKKFGLRDV